MVTTTLTVAGDVSDFDVDQFRTKLADLVGIGDPTRVHVTVASASVTVTVRMIMLSDVEATTVVARLTDSTVPQLDTTLGVTVTSEGFTTPIVTTELLEAPSPPPPAPPPPSPPPPAPPPADGLDPIVLVLLVALAGAVTIVCAYGLYTRVRIDVEVGNDEVEIGAVTSTSAVANAQSLPSLRV